MLLLAALLLGATGATSGPDLAERAVAVELPIAEVVVFSDRARVTRRGNVKLTGGPQVLRAPDVPGAVMLDSIRVTATGSTVVRVETLPVQRERWSIDQVDAWIVALEKRGDEMAVVSGALAAAHGELVLLSNLTAAPPLPEKDRLNSRTSPSPEAWKDAQDRLAKRRAAARVTEHELELKLRKLAAQYDIAAREVLKRDLGGFADKKIEVVVIVEGGAGTGSIAVEYAVPGAFWKPAYDLAFDPDNGIVELSASAFVTQATGEDWPQVKLALSTAIPGQGIDLPQLRTWTLGDDREYLPTSTARTTPRTTRPFQPPTPKPRLIELEREADRELLGSRTELLLALATTSSVSASMSAGAMSKGSGGGPGRARASMQRGDEPMVSSAMPMSMAAPVAAAPIDEQQNDPEALRMVDIMTASDSAAPGQTTRMQALALNNGIRWQRQTFGDPLLPAVSAGGLDYVYDAPVKITVPAQANALRVPLAVRRYPVQTFYEATPSLATTAYLKASVNNGSSLPILAGPANVFVKRTFAGDAQLMTTGPGGVLELPLGADEDIRLTRTVVPVTKTQGVFLGGEEDVTDYAVKIEVGNYKKQAITLRLIDQLPRTDAEKVKIEFVSTSTKPKTGPDADGLLSWHIDVPAGGVSQLTFTYRITRPKNWRLTQ